MTDRRYTDQRTGEVVDDPEIRSFDQVLRELGEGATLSELSEAFYDVVQRVQETARAGSVTLHLNIGFDGQGRLVVKDEVKSKLPEHDLPEATFFSDANGDLHRTDPAQSEMFKDTAAIRPSA